MSRHLIGAGTSEGNSAVANTELGMTVLHVSAQGGKGGAGRAERDMMRATVLEDAAIVCSTLSFSGSGAFGRMARPFDVVIVDEAAQTVEPSILIPLTAGCKQVILHLAVACLVRFVHAATRYFAGPSEGR